MVSSVPENVIKTLAILGIPTDILLVRIGIHEVP